MKTTYERGVEQGIERGIEQGIERGERRSALRLMEAKFGPLPAKIKQQLDALSPAALAQLQLDYSMPRPLRNSDSRRKIQTPTNSSVKGKSRHPRTRR
jgi:hypothetical protein